MCSFVGILWLGQFLIAAIGNHAHPLRLVLNFVNFDADFWVRSHPFDLASEGREHVDIARLVRKIYRHDVRQVIERTAKSSETGPCQKCATLFLVHFTDYHDSTSHYMKHVNLGCYFCHEIWLASSGTDALESRGITRGM